MRGTIGGGGAAFNVGEATVTRATVRLETGEVGHAYALGRDREKARLSAIADALWQDPARRDEVERGLLAPLRAAAREAAASAAPRPRRRASISSLWCAERTDDRRRRSVRSAAALPTRSWTRRRRSGR